MEATASAINLYSKYKEHTIAFKEEVFWRALSLGNKERFNSCHDLFPVLPLGISEVN